MIKVTFISDESEEILKEMTFRRFSNNEVLHCNRIAMMLEDESEDGYQVKWKVEQGE